MVAAPHVLINGHTKPLLETLRMVRAHTDTTSNLQFLLRDIGRLEVSASRVHLRAMYRLFWDADSTVKDRSADLDVTIDACADSHGRWAATHVGVFVRPARAHNPHGDAPSARPPVDGAGAGIPIYCVSMHRSTARREHMARQSYAGNRVMTA